MSDATSPTSSATTISLSDLSARSNVEVAWIVELVEHGVIDPHGTAQSDWHFEELTIVRLAKAKRLKRDLDLNPSGIALVLELLEQLDDLRAQLRARS